METKTGRVPEGSPTRTVRSTIIETAAASRSRFRLAAVELVCRFAVPGEGHHSFVVGLAGVSTLGVTVFGISFAGGISTTGVLVTVVAPTMPPVQPVEG